MNQLHRLAAPFHRLQWRLTLSYTLVTTGAMLVVELLFFGLVLYLLNSNVLANVMAQSMRSELVPAARTYLEQTPLDMAGLQVWAGSLMETQSQLSPTAGVQETTTLRLGQFRLSEAEQQFYVLAPDLTLLAQAAGPAAALGETWQAVGMTEAMARLQAAQQGNEVIARGADGWQMVALPVTAADGQVSGILVVIFRIPLLTHEILTPMLQALAFTLIPITLTTGLIGALFGFLTARGFTRRIRRVTAAADAWSRGEFSVVARDDSGDELGQLSHRLNRMAEQLQNLLATRQELVTLEERNRLARDLHDSVKQQIFAIAMQVGAARALLESDPAAAHRRLEEAETLARRSQQELGGLIQELRPAALEDKGLAEALRAYVADWSRHHQIAAQVLLCGERPLPLSIEQTLFRVAQEALANVARHSGAQTVDALLTWRNGTVTLTIRDDGRGFQPDRVPQSGVGLASMNERLAAINGRLTIASDPGQGTTVTAEVAHES